MNAIRFVCAAALLGAGAASAQSLPEVPLTLSCPLRHLPSQREIGNALGLDNFTQIYAARESVLESAKRDCLLGAREVVVSDSPARNPSRAIAMSGAKH